MRTVLAVLERDGEILAYARNLEHDCLREGYPTGEGYELCDGCQPHHHAEWLAIHEAILGKKNLAGATLHLFGHHYACTSCLQVSKTAGIDILISKKATP